MNHIKDTCIYCQCYGDKERLAVTYNQQPPPVEPEDEEVGDLDVFHGLSDI